MFHNIVQTIDCKFICKLSSLLLFICEFGMGWFLCVEGSFAEVVQLITAWHFASFLMPNMASKAVAKHGIGLSYLWMINAVSGIVFWCHVWRQKAGKVCTCNHLPNFGIWALCCVWTVWKCILEWNFINNYYIIPFKFYVKLKRPFQSI